MAEVTLPNGQVIEVADDAESYQVTVSLPSGFTTTANALTRAGESSSELLTEDEKKQLLLVAQEIEDANDANKRK